MFVLDKKEKRISKIKATTFRELGLKERTDLQVWIENNSEVFGEELLIIQKEYAGYDKTKERLDLLALDKHGDLVIIENKLDDSGRDVTLQALKYASYCSSFTKAEIKGIYQDYLDKENIQESCEDKLTQFFRGEEGGEFEDITLNQNQRIILVSNTFRPEVTSTVLWLLNKHNLKIKCFTVKPHPFDGQIFIDIEQIIPIKEAQEYMIKMAEKAQEEQNTQDKTKVRYTLRMEFWKILLSEMNKRCKLFANIRPSQDYWIQAATGLAGVGFNLIAAKNYAGVEVYMSRSRAEENKYIFDKLIEVREDIEKEIPGIQWEELVSKKASRIKIDRLGLSLYDRNAWDAMISFLIEYMLKLERVFSPLLMQIKNDKEWVKLTRKDSTE